MNTNNYKCFPTVDDFKCMDDAIFYADKMLGFYGQNSDIGKMAIDLFDNAFDLHPNRFDDNCSGAEMRAMDGDR